MIDLFEDIKKMIANDFGLPEEDIEEDSLLDEDLSITDLDLEDFLTKLQEKYEVEIPPEKTGSFKKVSDIVNYLYEKSESQG